VLVSGQIVDVVGGANASAAVEVVFNVTSSNLGLDLFGGAQCVIPTILGALFQGQWEDGCVAGCCRGGAGSEGTDGCECDDACTVRGELCDQRLECSAQVDYAMLCYAMLCYAMLCWAMLCYAVLCYAVPCYAMLCHAMLCCAMLCHANAGRPGRRARHGSLHHDLGRWCRLRQGCVHVREDAPHRRVRSRA
jgi:hypothetical protein